VRSTEAIDERSRDAIDVRSREAIDERLQAGSTLGEKPGAFVRPAKRKGKKSIKNKYCGRERSLAPATANHPPPPDLGCLWRLFFFSPGNNCLCV